MANRPAMAPSTTLDSVQAAFDHFGLRPLAPKGKSVHQVLRDEGAPQIDVDSLRQGPAAEVRAKPSEAPNPREKDKIHGRIFMASRQVRRVDGLREHEGIGVPRGVQSNMRRTATVEEGRCYLTLDTACENTVAGTTILQKIAVHLGQHQGLQALIRPETEAYCFGPGAPMASQERWSVPIGVLGRPAVICTSSVQDKDCPKIPFLAGQDWMVFMSACVDVGRHVAVLRELDVVTPLFIDHTGHLVIAIDEMPPEGWPNGLVARKNGYPGVLFEGYARDVREAAKPAGKNEVVVESADMNFATTHYYEPNTSERFPCTVSNDYWQYMIDKGIYVRHHVRPRRSFFEPQDTKDGPDRKDLQPVRVTVMSCDTEPVCVMIGLLMGLVVRVILGLELRTSLAKVRTSTPSTFRRRPIGWRSSSTMGATSRPEPGK